MSRYLRITESHKAALIGSGMFIILLTLTQLLSYFWYDSARQKEIQRLAKQVNAKKERLHVTLSNSLSCIRTLAFLVEEKGVPENFDRIAEKLLTVNPLVDAIELLQQGVITHVFPVNGNEAALGYDILTDTIRHSGALKAIRTRDFFFAGPVELKQGGIAIIGRQPIFMDDKFWGFSAVLIHLSNFIKTTGIDYDKERDFIYQLSRVNPDDGSEEFFLPSEDSFEKGDSMAIEIPNTEWRLYVNSKKRKEIAANAIALSFLGLLFSLTVGSFSYFIAVQPKKLNELVTHRTAQLIMEKELSDAIINGLPGIFYLYDKERKFLRWNKNFEIISGYSAAEICTMSPLDFFEGDDKELLNQKINKVFEHGKAEVEANFYTKGKRKITYYFNGNIAQYQGKTYLTGMGIDITKRVDAEKAIHNLNLDLQSTIERLQSRNNDLQQFSYAVSHNLRTPLARILGLVSIFNHDASNNQFIIQKIAEAATQLDDVIKDINEVVSGRNVEKTYEYVSFEDTLQRVRKTLEDDITQSNAEITADFAEAPGVVTIKSCIFSIMYNLISNAIKYRQKGVPLKIYLRSQKVDQGVCLAITDNGTGMDLHKDGEKLFVLYKRFCEDSIPGKGIGLYLVKSQVESLDGSINVTSAVNQGSTFNIYLPIKNETGITA